MVEIARRELMRMGGALSLALGVDGVAVAAGASPDPLAHVAPELREAARTVLAMGAAISPMTDAKIPTLRSVGEKMAPPPLPGVPVATYRVPVSAAIPDVTVYAINARPGTQRPAILHTHGGGFVGGSARAERRYLQGIAQALDCVIVSVEYSLAPEARWSRSVEENYAGLRWLHAQAATLGVDRSRIAVMGESAGGGHAALLAIRARDHGELPLVLQVLIYPMLDDRTGSTVTPPPFVGAVGWDAQANRFGWQALLGLPPGTARVPAAAVPARLADPAGLAPAFIAVGGVDLFVGEDIDYARRLTLAGVPTELLVVPGAFHAFDRVAEQAPQSIAFTRAKMDALRRAFGLASTTA
ncbi:esterase [Sphingomonas metalli]|uniref:Esterase n=1 Tax=Sphingomonas metalli TaxID=1779358 RepID=A0A916TAG9_9SPHN|nr:alpha/beta hydrolase [Sphingomonas metalli]GGB36256.1 esterase [Sphingomonas metalli]